MARKSKLEAIAKDPSASPNERSTARRLLSQLADGEDEEFLICVRESWEVALLDMLATRQGLGASRGANGFVQIVGSQTDLDELLRKLITLHPMLEDIIVSATAGFLAAHFPPASSTATGVEDAVQAAARKAAKVQQEAPKQLGLREAPKQLAQHDK